MRAPPQTDQFICKTKLMVQLDKIEDAEASEDQIENSFDADEEEDEESDDDDDEEEEESEVMSPEV